MKDLYISSTMKYFGHLFVSKWKFLCLESILTWKLKYFVCSVSPKSDITV